MTLGSLSIHLVYKMVQRGGLLCRPYYYFASNRRAKYYDRCVCLSVCVFIRKPLVQQLWNFLMSSDICGCSSVLLWRHTLRTSGFVDYVMFPHDGANAAESNSRRHVSSSSLSGGTGGEVCYPRLPLSRWNFNCCCEGNWVNSMSGDYFAVKTLSGVPGTATVSSSS